ncbi:MAG: hypothetical protein ABSA05_09685, partial [Opitutaceae bacterium]
SKTTGGSMKAVLLVAACLVLAGCSDRERDARIAALEKANFDLANRCARDETAIETANRQIDAMKSDVDRYRMFNGNVGSGDLAFLYDSKTGRVWRYFRNWSEDHKTATDEGFEKLIDPSQGSQAAFDPSTATPIAAPSNPPTIVPFDPKPFPKTNSP